MLVMALTVCLLGIVVGLYRRVGALWVLLALSVLLVPMARLFTGGTALAVFLTTAAWLVALQIGYLVGLFIRLHYGSALSADSKAQYGKTGMSAERRNVKTSTN
jgi:hypothetical protein